MPDGKPYHASPDKLATNIQKLLVLPCDIPPSIWWETGLPSLVSVLWAIGSPDPTWKEQFHMFAGCSIWGTLRQEVEDMHVASGTPMGPVSRGSLRLGAVFDVGLWWLFLAGSLHRGLTQWTSQILRVSSCGEPTNPNQGGGNFYFGAVNEEGDWEPMAYSFGHGTIYYPVSHSTVYIPPHSKGFIACTQGFHEIGGNPVPCISRIRCVEDGRTIASGETQMDHGLVVGPAAAWSSFRNDTGHYQQYVYESKYTGGMPLPSGVAIGDSDGHCFLGTY